MASSDAPIAYGFRRPGPGLTAVLVVVAVLGIVEPALVKWAGYPQAFELLTCEPAAVLNFELWRLLTSGFLSDLLHPSDLFFNLVGLYFLSPDLESRWGTRRFLVFLGTCIVAGNLLTILVDVLAPQGLHLLHPAVVFGPGSALTGIAVAWAIYNRHAVVNLMFIFPVNGRTLFWFVLVGCCFYTLYMGSVMGFGGVFTGMALAGDPSPVRRAYLNLKLAMLRRRGVPTAEDIALGRNKPRRASRAGGPDLRVVRGGQADADDEQRRPPKDKRYLN
jgi:membrane associated rhomboid family serine protease